MTKPLLKLLIAGLLTFLLFKTTLSQSDVQQVLAERNEAYLTFMVEDESELVHLTRIISIDRVDRRDGIKVFAYVNSAQFSDFQKFGKTYDLLASPGINPAATTVAWFGNRNAMAWDTYPTYPSYVAMMYGFESTYPDLCEVISIGQTVNNREILYIKISSQTTSTVPKPRINYSSTMHGDETTGFVLMLRLIDHLLANYGIDPEVTQLVDDVEIWINPNANPDGTYYGGDNTVASAIRYNANGADLNRNFKDFMDGDHPDNLSWQPETMAFMAFADSIHFVLGANFHGGVEVVNYPWDTQAGLNADDDWWIHVSREYADTTHVLSSGTGYMTYLNNGITNGFAWYEANGTRQDYMNYYHRCREFTLEISTVKNPAASTLPTFWNYNFRSLMNYMKQVNYGIRGVVTDSITGDPLLAMVTINGHDNLNTDVETELPFGVYYRPIAAGTYNITYWAPGYQSKTISTSISNYQQITQNVQLVMVSPEAIFETDDIMSCNGLVEFENQSITSEGSDISWDFGDGNTSSEWSPQHQYTENGTYTVSLTVSNLAGSSTFVYPVAIEINMPAAPMLEAIAVCEGEIIEIPGTDTNTVWYASAESTQAIYQGAVFTSGPLSNDTIFWAENVIQNPSVYTGKPDNSGTGGYFSNSQIHYLVFDCFEASILKRVTLYSNSSGSKVISLRDDAGNVLQTRTVTVSNVGAQVVELGFELPVANNLQLAGPANPGFYRNNDPTSIQYPYEIPGLISVKSSSAGTSPLSYYYYFYNWEVEPAPCKSIRQSVPVEVFEQGPNADFNYTISNDTVYFENLSAEGYSYEWNFGDGNIESGTFSPWHIYSESGTYTVILHVGNPCGSDSKEKELQISIGIEETPQADEVRIYPNPVNQELYFNLPEAINQISTEICIYDLSGRKTRVDSPSIDHEKNLIRINVSNLSSGIYTLSIQSVDHHYFGKFILHR